MGKCKETGKECLGQSWYCDKEQKNRLVRNSMCTRWERMKKAKP